MSVALSVFRAQIKTLISAVDDELSQLSRDRIIRSAVGEFSVDFPRKLTADLSGDGGKYYALNSANLSGWLEGSSRVLSIQYPAADVSADETPIWLKSEDWDDDYWDGSTRYLWLPNHSPAATEAMRIVYSVPYSWTASSETESVRQDSHGFSVDDWVFQEDGTWYSTTDERVSTHQVTVEDDSDNFTAALVQTDVPPSDFFPVCNLAAGLCCRTIAARYSRTSDSTISLDSVDHLSRAQQWSMRAEEFIKEYRSSMNLDAGGDGEEKRVKPTGQIVEIDVPAGPSGGRRWLFHGRR